MDLRDKVDTGSYSISLLDTCRVLDLGRQSSSRWETVRISCVPQPQSPRAPGQQLFQGREHGPLVNIIRWVHVLVGDVWVPHTACSLAQSSASSFNQMMFIE